jgi:hypothetical protein
MRRSALLLLGLALALPACRESPAEPEAPRVRLAALGDSVVFAPADASATDPVRVVAVHAVTGSPVAGVQVTWQVPQGGLGLSPAVQNTDTYGVAAALPVQTGTGVFRVTASAPRMVGAAPSINVHVVHRPAIASLPAAFAAGEEITISGSNFSTVPAHNAVYFDGVRGTLTAASATELRVRVPACLPARGVVVRVGLGAVLSAPRSAGSTGGTVAEIALQPGQSHTAATPDQLGCTRLAANAGGALYLIGVHNTAASFAPRSSFELRTLTPQAVVAAPIHTRAPGAASFADAWELELRRRERTLGPMDPAMPGAHVSVLPSVGERRQFNVIDRENRFLQVTAEVRHVSNRGIFYLDVEALSTFTDADLQYLGSTFDDPIYPTNTAVFGEPSDLDGNQRIIILFTPRVNALTPRNQSSFIAGYFYGCDLVSRNRCSGSNSGEVFYSMVPDPAAQWGDARSRSLVMNSVPPVLAHEFQHMIHFARRGFSADALWLSESLAHTAEELVADVFTGRGQTAMAALFRNGNLHRAQMYLDDPAATSMLAEEPPGTLELRGAGWLFLKYLRGHFGGTDLLRRLTASTRNSAANVSHETGESWGRLVTDFGVAIYADNAPELQGSLAARHRFADFNLRATLGALPGGFPLRPTTANWADAWFTGDVPSASHEHFLFFDSGLAGQPLSVVLAGRRGAPLDATADLQLSIVRLR